MNPSDNTTTSHVAPHARPARLADSPLVHRLYSCAPEYFEMLGTPCPTPADVETELGLALMDERRHVELLEIGGECVGLLDWKAHYPNQADVTVNLVLIDAAQRGRGLGRKVIRGLEARLPQGTERVLASVLGHNPVAARFWEQLGYVFAVDARPVMSWYAKAVALGSGADAKVPRVNLGAKLARWPVGVQLPVLG